MLKRDLGLVLEFSSVCLILVPTESNAIRVHELFMKALNQPAKFRVYQKQTSTGPKRIKTAGIIQEYLTVLHIMVSVNQIAEKFM